MGRDNASKRRKSRLKGAPYGGKVDTPGSVDEETDRDDSTSSTQTKRRRSDAIGIYNGRKGEIKRLNSDPSIGVRVVEEAEHVLSAAAILSCQKDMGLIPQDSNRNTKEGRRLVGRAPTFQVPKRQHRQHAGTGTRRGLKNRGWEDSERYRADQAEALKASVALDDPQSLSIPFQLNQLGYAFQFAEDGLQSDRPGGKTAALRRSTNSYLFMIGRNQGLPLSNGEELRLMPEQQAEAALVRQGALSGRWPTERQHRKTLNEYLALDAAIKDIDTKNYGLRKGRNAMVSALSRTSSLMSISSSSEQSDATEDNDSGTHKEQRRIYNLRSRGRTDEFGR